MSPAARPAADIVVPVAAREPAQLRAIAGRLRATLALAPGDTLTVVDNRGLGAEDPDVLVAAEVRTSYHARNRGAGRGRAPWLVFLDADVTPQPGLLDALLTPEPGAAVGVLAGAVVDADLGHGAGIAERFTAARAAMDQERLLARGHWAFAQTAHAAVRRSAFEAVGGFDATVRSGGDADLCWRLREAGWGLESRPDAVVVHAGRAHVPALLSQCFRHGTGAGWLAARWPGALPARRWPGLLRWGVVRALAGVRAALRGDRDAAALGLLDGPATWAFELGRLAPNRPLRRLGRTTEGSGGSGSPEWPRPPHP
jgi:Glycosyltransferase like family 2